MLWVWRSTHRLRLAPWQPWVTWATAWSAHLTWRPSSGRWRLSTGWSLGTRCRSLVVVEKALTFIFLSIYKSSDECIFFLSTLIISRQSPPCVSWTVLGANSWLVAYLLIHLLAKDEPSLCLPQGAAVTCPHHARPSLDLSSGARFIRYVFQLRGLDTSCGIIFNSGDIL